MLRTTASDEEIRREAIRLNTFGLPKFKVQLAATNPDANDIAEVDFTKRTFPVVRMKSIRPGERQSDDNQIEVHLALKSAGLI